MRFGCLGAFNVTIDHERKGIVMMVEPYISPEVPKASNDTGVPTPPSGTHPVNTAETVIIKAEGGKGLPAVPIGAGSNIHTSEG